MPQLRPIQTGFSAGELSPRLLARTDTTGYKAGASKLENMIPLAQGPARRRSGIRFAQELPAGIDAARVIPFPISVDDYFLLVFYDLNMVVLNKFGEVVVTERVLNSEFNTGGASWTTFEPGPATVIFSLVSCTMNPALVAGNAAIQQLVTGLSIGIQQRLRVTQISPLRSLRLRVGNSAGDATLGQLVSSNASSVLVFTPTATSHWIEVAAMTPSVNTVLLSVSVQSTGSPLAPVASPYLEENLNAIQYEMEPFGNKMVLVDGIHPVQQVSFTAPITFTLAAATITAPPAEWVANSYPRCVAFYQGRLWYGGSTNNPATLWSSKSGLYYDMTSGALADDAIVLTIAKRGPIRWISGAKSLLVGTEVQEFVISAEAGVLTPSDAVLDPQSAYGSTLMQPSLLGNIVLYITADGRKLYSMGYRFEESGWVSTDLTFAAEHVSINRIVNGAYAQNPGSIMWFVDAQGGLIGCSYDRGNKVIGWHRHPMLPIISSLCTVKLVGSDITWVAYRTTRNAVNFTQIGQMVLPFGTGIFSDAAKIVTLATPGLTFTGFQHLAEQVVSVVADGAVHPNVTVSSGGVITLQVAALTITAGLPNKALLTTMPFEPGDMTQGTQPLFKRFNRVYAQLYGSSKPKINGIRPPDRTPSSPMNLAEPLSTGVFFVTNLGWGFQETITIEEDLPVDLHVLGVFGEMAAE